MQALVHARQQAIHAADASVRALKDREAYLRIAAPFDGVVTDRMAHPGALVGSGSDARCRDGDLAGGDVAGAAVGGRGSAAAGGPAGGGGLAAGQDRGDRDGAGERGELDGETGHGNSLVRESRGGDAVLTFWPGGACAAQSRCES